ncbi:MAG: SDR family NAD(P)-dependent oxidoreductase [Wenzhouxiangella sp.]
MLRSMASLLFYARFLRSFSAIGFRRRARHWPDWSPDFTGQTWLVTGASGGIGRAIALAANRHGARVLAVARSESKLKSLKAEAAAPTRLVPVKTDLSLITRIRSLSETRAVATRPIDVLVNNVGVLLNDHQMTDEGLEQSFATNLLGPFVMTEALIRGGRLAADGLVVGVSSGGMYGTPLRLEAMNENDPRAFDGMAAYAMHKRAMVTLTQAWNAEWQGTPKACVMHPGWVDTDGVRTALPVFRRVLKTLLRDAEQGADTVLWLADQRPEGLTDTGIWLDRERQPEHEFAFTRNSPHGANDLLNYLRGMAERVA